MSNSDVAARRLRVVRDLPVLLEAAFRAAAREIAYLRPARTAFTTDMKARARLHLERLVRESHVADLDLREAEFKLDRSIERFARTSLRRRLTTMPVHRLHAIDDSALDLVVDDRHGKRYALRFVGFRPRDLTLPKTPTSASTLGSLLVYDIDRGRLRRFDRGELSSRAVIAPLASGTSAVA